MGKSTVHAFTGGEADGPTLGRTDIPVAPSLAEVLENIYLATSGRMELAPGSRYITDCPGITKVRGWSFSPDSYFGLAFSDELLRFIYDVGVVELTGAAATVATFTDESAVMPAGGDPPPSGGGGSGNEPPDDSGEWVWIDDPRGGYWYWTGSSEYGQGGEIP